MFSSVIRISAGLAACALFSSVYAQDVMLDPVVVTASRFDQPRAQAAASVTVIDREEISASNARNITELLATRAGVDVRSLYGPLAVDASVDLRGFGETAGSHTLVLLDGQRLNPIDMGSVPWESVPLALVQRIEIVRGGGSVLYGDRAVGGVINIITDKSGKSLLGVEGGLGSYGYKTLAADFAGKGPGYFSLSARSAETNGWRENNHARQQVVSARVGRRSSEGHGLQFDASVYQQSYGLPGGISEADFNNDPRHTDAPNDWAKRDGYRVRPGGSWVFSDTLRAEAEISFDELRARFNNWGYRDTRVRTLAVTPRLKWEHGLGGLRSETVFGFDGSWADLHSDRAAAPGGAITNVVAVDQDSTGWYAFNQTWFSRDWQGSFGVRRQQLDQQASDQASVSTLANKHSKTVSEFGLSGRLSADWRIFAKAAQVFRFANTDELTTFSGLGSALRPERGNLVQLGAELQRKAYSSQLTVYDMRLTDEIAYNSMTFQNENLARTRHSGLEWDGRWQATPALTIRGAYAWTRATFRAGADAGKRVPLVPQQRASLGLEYKQGGWTHGLSLAHTGARYFGADTSNSSPKLPSHTTLDLRTAYAWQAWRLSAEVRNALDKRYADLAYVNFYYPADGRSLFVKLRREW